MLVYRVLSLLILSSFVYHPAPDSAFAQTSSQSAKAPSSKPDVMLHVLVTDSQNRPAGNLSQENFQVAEEDVPQTIAFFSKDEMPINYVLAIDISGSLKDRISEIITARTIEQIEFSAAIYDRARREQVEQRSLSKEVAIKPGKTEDVELTIVARLPSDNLILLEIRKVIFSDGTSWVTDTEYVLSGDMSRVERKQK